MWPKENKKKVSGAIRILQQKRDASARATHLKAESWKFQSSTIERKQMSTKTSFKRIALVATSALAIAGFSAVPAANAAVGTATTIVVSKYTTIGPVLTPLVAGYYTASTVLDSAGVSSFSVTAGDTFTLKLIPTVGGIGSDDSVTVTLRGYGNLTTNSAAAAAAVGLTSDVTPLTATSVPGTYTLDVSVNTWTASGYVTSATTNVTMVVAAGSSLDIGQSTAYMTAGTAGGASASSTTNAIPRTGSKVAGTQIAQIKVTLLDDAGVADNSAHTISAYVTGGGYVEVNTTANTDTAFTTRVSEDSATNNLRYVHIEADGTAGVGTVTVSVTDAATSVSTVLGTFSYSTFGDVTAFALAATNFTVGVAGGDTTGYGGTTRTAAGNLLSPLDAGTTVPAFIVKATDVSGNVANLTPTISSSATSVVASGTCGLDGGIVDVDNAAATSSTNGIGYYNCSFTTAASAKTGDKATLTIRALDPADATVYISTTINVTVGSTTAATETLTLDAASYEAGAPMLVTRTAVDASGNVVADGTASPAVSFTKATGGTTPAIGWYVNGSDLTSADATAPAVFAPAVSGSFEAYATSAAGTTIKAVATIDADPSASLALDAANAATDAANNAYDEAQNATQAASDALAATSALAKQVKKLIAEVKKLAKAVSKL